jgi:hypothetical protein
MSILGCMWELLQAMTPVSVPSTLVKCLYLFFDLPEIENPDTAENGSEFTPRERRILLQKIFVQVNNFFFPCVTSGLEEYRFVMNMRVL